MAPRGVGCVAGPPAGSASGTWWWLAPAIAVWLGALFASAFVRVGSRWRLRR